MQAKIYDDEHNKQYFQQNFDSIEYLIFVALNQDIMVSLP